MITQYIGSKRCNYFERYLTGCNCFKNLIKSSIPDYNFGNIFTGNANGSNPFLSTIGFTFIAIAFAGLIHAGSSNSSRLISVFFNYRWLRFTGKISYGLYIFHWIVLRALEPRLEQWLIKFIYFNNQTAHGLSLFICLVMSYIISVISYFYFELYFLKQKVH